MPPPDKPVTLTIREAVDKVFIQPGYQIPAGSIHTWTQQGFFTPYETVVRRSKKGCKLDEADLVYLPICRTILQAGVKFSAFSTFHFHRGHLDEINDKRLAEAEKVGRGAQAYLEIHSYKVFVYVRFRPLTGGQAYFIRFQRLKELSSEISAVSATMDDGRFNLAPHVFINALAHYEYIKGRLKALGKK